MEIKFSIDTAQVERAFRKAPETMRRSLDRYLGRAAQEVARTARDKAAEHDDYGALKQSIQAEESGLLRYTVAPGVQYARFVEDGTMPGYFPNFGALLDWVNTPRRRGFKLAKAGTPRRESQVRELHGRAYALGRYIKQHGTKAHPFMAPTQAATEDRVRQLIREGVDAGLKEVFG